MLRLIAFFSVCLLSVSLWAQAESPVESPMPDVSADAVPLNPEATILLDKKQNRLLLKTKVCLREGVLEMFICPKQTKEHETILSLPGKAQIVHAGLLALGAKPGHPAQFRPEYAPPTGAKIEIYVNWIDAEKKPQRMRAQDWIRHATYRYFEAPLASVPAGVKLAEKDNGLRYDDLNQMLIFFGSMSEEAKKKYLAMSEDKKYREAVESLFAQGQFKQLEADFVFAGSTFQKREDGTEFYTAEAGSLVCVANFGDALLDINMQSTASNDSGLLFEPWTERVPAVGTNVLVELVPVK